MKVSEIIALVSEVIALFGIFVGYVASIGKIINGTKCLLRSEMLSIYYKHQDAKEIRQYEYENFIYLYEAYNKLRGNSFIDKVYEEMKKWKVIT